MLDLTIIGPAFLTGILVLFTHVPLGKEVLNRGIIFIDLAVAQIAGLGVILAYRFGWEVHGWETQLIAFVSALLGAILLGLTEKVLRKNQEALIGITFILAATGGVLLLDNNPHAGDQLKDLLTGQILWVNWSDLWPLLIVTVVVLIGRWLLTERYPLAFYVLFACAVTASVQYVGVYLVFASLIIPAFFSQLARQKASLIIPMLIGVLGYAGGLLGSAWFDLPSGPSIVWALAVVGLLLWMSMKLISGGSIRSEL